MAENLDLRPGAADRMYLAHLAPADPPLNNGDLIYLRGSDCPCRGELRGRPLTRRGAPGLTGTLKGVQ